MSEKKIHDNPNQDVISEDVGADRKVGSGETRRKALKKIAIGGGAAAGMAILPEKWAKPLVDVIVVPAHAVISPTTSSPPVSTTVAPKTTSPPVTTTAAPTTTVTTTTPAPTTTSEK